MGEAFLNKKASGSKIDGIIQEYYAAAGENISAGDFVNFVEGLASEGVTETQVKLASAPPFDGLAKTGGEGGDDTEHKDIVKVYVPQGVN